MHTSITWKKPGAHVVAWCFCQSDKKIEWGKKSQLVNGDIQIIFLKKNIQIIYHWTLFSKLYYWTIHVHVVWYSTPCAESWLQSLCSAGSLQCCTYKAPCRHAPLLPAAAAPQASAVPNRRLNASSATQWGQRGQAQINMLTFLFYYFLKTSVYTWRFVMYWNLTTSNLWND